MLGSSPGRSKAEHLLDVLQKEEQKGTSAPGRNKADANEEEMPALLAGATFSAASKVHTVTHSLISLT